MPTEPAPGRIPPMQRATNTPSTVANATETAKDPTSAAVNRFVSGAVDQGVRNRLQRAKKKAGNKGVPAQPTYRISMFESGVVIAILVTVDFAEIIAGLLFETGVGEAVNFAIDIVVALILTAYCKLRLKFEFAEHWKRYASIWGAFVGELLPVANIASFWIIDGVYIMYTVRAEDKKIHQQLLAAAEEERKEAERQIFMENFARQQAETAQGENDMV